MAFNTEIQLIARQSDIIEVLREVGTKQGCRVRHVPDGEAALATAGESTPDLILLDADAQWPDTDGYEICRRLKANDHTCDIPILFLIPQKDVDAKTKAFAAGAADIITKPFQAAEVAARVAPYLALRREMAERRRAEAMLQEKSFHLGERVKELNCLYGIASLVEQPNISLPDILQGTVNLIPPAWQYPEITCTRIVLDNTTYKTDNFASAAWQQTSEIIVHGSRVGILEVGYLEERPAGDEGPFLKEERNLLDAIAERLGRVVERKQAEKELRENERLLRQIAGHFPNSYISVIEKDMTVGFTGGQEFANRNLDPTQFEGLTLEQVFGKKVPFITERYQKAFRGERTEFELFIDNQHQLYQTVPLPDEEGQINRILAVVRNETERKEAERKIQESEEFFRTISEQMTDMVYVTDVQGVVIYVSPAVETIFGMKPLEMQGRRFIEFLAETEIETALKAFASSVRDGIPARNLQLVMKRKDGSTFLGELNGTFYQGDGQTGTIGLIRDITELRQAEEALRAREEEYRLLVENQSDLVVKVDQEGRFEFVSPSYCKLFGKSEAELLGHNFVPLIHEDDRADTLQAMENLYQPPYRVQLEQRAMTADGWRWLQWVDTAILDEAGNVTAIIGIGRDITEQKRSEAINAARLHLLQFSITHSLDDLLEETLNEAEKLTDSRIGFYHFINEDQKSLTLQAWSTRTKKELCQAEGQGEHYDIEQAGVWVDCFYQRKPVIHNDYAALPHRKGLPEGHADVNRELVVPVFRGDKISAILGVGNKPTDYTQKDVETVSLLANLAWEIAVRKQAEESLKLLNQAVEQSPVMVVITNADGIIQYVNPKFSQVTGYSAAEAVGQNPRILKSGRHSDGFYQKLWDTITGGREWRGEFNNRKKNGKLYWELVSIVGVKNQNGKITHYVAVKEDITQRKRSEEQHVRQERLAAVGQLAAGIAHDFNNILTSIIGFAELLQNTPNADPNLKRIVEQGQRAAELTRQILDFSRQTVNKPQPLDMRIYLNETLKFVERTIPETIQIQFNFERGDHTIHADPTQLQQVITNLAVNARDAMPDGGTLYFDLSTTSLAPEDAPPCSEMEAGEWVRLAVTDTGSGIAPEALPHIFEPFFTTKQVGQGTGLGLAQIYGIVMQHNGCITVNSRVGHGTTFTIYFPALPDHNAVTEAPVNVIPHGQGETVLLVEDEQVVRQVIETMLETLNYRVISASDGAEALAICRTQADRIALVLTDVVMPGMDGYALASALQTDVPGLSVLLISGYGRESGAGAVSHPNVVGRLTKPLNIPQLAQALHEALQNSATT